MANQRQQNTRQRLGLALRQHRVAAGLTQKQAADRLYLSVSTMIRLESGASPVSHVDLDAITALYGVTDQAEKGRLSEWVTIALRPSPWRQYQDIHTPQALILFESEAAATIMYKFESQLVPGLLQTEAYARTVLESLGSPNVDRHVECRRARQEILSQQLGQRPDLQFIISEAVISRAVGGRQVMIDQVEHLKTLAQQPGISLRILPFAAGAHPRMGAAFSVLQFQDDVDELLYLENPDGEVIERDDPARIADYLQNFFALAELSCQQDDFADFADRILSERFDGHANPPPAG